MLGSQSPRKVNPATSLDVLQFIGSDGSSVDPTRPRKTCKQTLVPSNLVLQDCVHVFWYSYLLRCFDKMANDKTIDRVCHRQVSEEEFVA